MHVGSDLRFAAWVHDLEQRHLSDLTFAEVARALRALSSAYVEHRGRLSEGAALAGAGKRAAFALFYGPLHFALVRAIVNAIPEASRQIGTLVDLGCGTGASGSAWAAACRRPPVVSGFDRSAWAVAEARRTYRAFGLRARTVQADVARAALPESPAALVVAFTANELDEAGRALLLDRLLERARRGDRVLVVEPIARRIAPWWDGWSGRMVAAGGRADEWRFAFDRPPILEKLDRAAGLDHRELTARSLYIGEAVARLARLKPRPTSR